MPLTGLPALGVFEMITDKGNKVPGACASAEIIGRVRTACETYREAEMDNTRKRGYLRPAIQIASRRLNQIVSENRYLVSIPGQS